MNRVLMNRTLDWLVLFFTKSCLFRTLLLGILLLVALLAFRNSGLERRTFVFFSLENRKTLVEERMLAKSSSPEGDIRRYVEEALLGPASPDATLLFPAETTLRSLMLRDGVVYIDFSETAALQSQEGGEVLENFTTLYRGIRRNFNFVRGIKFFIIGNESFIDHFNLANQ